MRNGVGDLKSTRFLQKIWNMNKELFFLVEYDSVKLVLSLSNDKEIWGEGDGGEKSREEKYYLSSYRYQCVKLVIQTFSISANTVVHEVYVVNGIFWIKFCNANI